MGLIDWAVERLRKSRIGAPASSGEVHTGNGSATAGHREPMDYHEFYGFTQPPFELTPDPALLVLSHAHEEALDKFYRGILSGRGFLVLTGDVGTGKTLLLHTIMGLLPDEYQVAYVFHSHLSSEDLLEIILTEFGVNTAADATQAQRLRAMSSYLIDARRRGLKPVVMIDEAQNLNPTTLEELRVISNLETPEGKLVQFVLAGQTELIELLNQPRLRQLKQRIGVRDHLSGLSATETYRYIVERCRMSGRTESPFDKALVLRIYAVTKGVPRLINSVCDALLLATYLEATREITLDHLRAVQRDYDL